MDSFYQLPGGGWGHGLPYTDNEQSKLYGRVDAGPRILPHHRRTQAGIPQEPEDAPNAPDQRQRKLHYRRGVG